MSLKYKSVFILIFFLSAFHVKSLFAQQEILEKCLPDSSIINTQWKLCGDSEYYIGDDLFFLINGGAELYLEYGFQDVLSSSYCLNNSKTKIRVDLFRMSDKAAALGIMSGYVLKGEKLNIGNEALLTNQALIFRKGDIYAMIQGSNIEENDTSMIYFAELISAMIPDTLKFTEYFIQDTLSGQNPKTVFIRGNIALNNHYYFGIPNLFNFVSAWCFIYSNSKIISLTYTDENMAKQDYQELRNYLPESKKYEFNNSDDEVISFTDRKQKDIQVYQSGRFIIFTINMVSDKKQNFLDFLLKR